MAQGSKIILKFHISKDKIKTPTNSFLLDILYFFASEERREEYEQWKMNNRIVIDNGGASLKLVPPLLLVFYNENFKTEIFAHKIFFVH